MNVLLNGCSHSTSQNYFNTKNNTNSLPITAWWSRIFQNFGITQKNVYSIFNTQSKTNWHLYKHIFDDNYSFYSILDNIIKNSHKDVFISSANDGKGNDAIFFETMELLKIFEEKNKKFDFVIVQWSGHSRRIVSVDEDDEWKWNDYIPNGENRVITFANPHDNVEAGINFEPAGSYLTLNYMLLLQDYLVEKKYPYVFINYFPMDSDIKNQYIYEKLNLNNFVSFNDNLHPIWDGWLNHIVDNNLSCDEFGHPNPDGHIHITNRVIKKVYELYKIGSFNNNLIIL